MCVSELGAAGATGGDVASLGLIDDALSHHPGQPKRSRSQVSNVKDSNTDSNDSTSRSCDRAPVVGEREITTTSLCYELPSELDRSGDASPKRSITTRRHGLLRRAPAFSGAPLWSEAHSND